MHTTERNAGILGGMVGHTSGLGALITDMQSLTSDGASSVRHIVEHNARDDHGRAGDVLRTANVHGCAAMHAAHAVRVGEAVQRRRAVSKNGTGK